MIMTINRTEYLMIFTSLDEMKRVPGLAMR